MVPQFGQTTVSVSGGSTKMDLGADTGVPQAVQKEVPSGSALPHFSHCRAGWSPMAAPQKTQWPISSQTVFPQFLQVKKWVVSSGGSLMPQRLQNKEPSGALLPHFGQVMKPLSSCNWV